MSIVDLFNEQDKKSPKYKKNDKTNFNINKKTNPNWYIIDEYIQKGDVILQPGYYISDNSLLLFEPDKKKREQYKKNLTLSSLKEAHEKSQNAELIITSDYMSKIIRDSKPKKYRGLLITNYMENAKKFHKEQPFFYDKTGVFWFWKNDHYEMVDEIDVMNHLDNILGFMGQTVTTKIKQNYLEAFKRYGRQMIPKSAPSKWVQFKNKAYSINSGKIYDVQPNFFFTNPIPWKLGTSCSTPQMDKLFKEWVGEDYVQTMYEILAYCCYAEYPLQTLFCLYGVGRNGKSQFLKIIEKFIGKDNCCSTELDLLTGNGSSRFESFKLYKKLVCTMGETNFGVLNKSSILKKLTGGDLIGFEMKGKKPFDDYSYAKLIIASNTLPMSQDTSDGFYRRWLIINFPNQFPEGKDILSTIPEEEYENLALKCCGTLANLLEQREFTNQGDPEERKHNYIMASNPFPMFVKERLEQNYDGFIRFSELYSQYVIYLKRNGKRVVSKKEFGKVVDEEGFEIRRTSKSIDGNYISDRYLEQYSFKGGMEKEL